MEAAGKEPGRNLANKLLNEGGQASSLLRGEDGVQHARGQLLHTLRQRVRFAPADLDAKLRLAEALRLRGFYQDALPLVQEAVAVCVSTYGPESTEALTCQGILGAIFVHVGNFCEAEKLHRQVLDIRLKTLGPEHESTVWSMGELAVALPTYSAEKIGLHRQVLASKKRTLVLAILILCTQSPTWLLFYEHWAISAKQ